MFEVHNTAASHILDHCSTHALSDPEEDIFRVLCDHSHDKCRPSCDQLKSIITEIEPVRTEERTSGDFNCLSPTGQCRVIPRTVSPC